MGERPGKNDAINKILSYARGNKKDIIHFFDDDIEFLKGSIVKNLNTLIEYPRGEHVLIGSDFKVRENVLSVIQKILNAPFEIQRCNDY
ncbi:glycosyltransferase family A protein [Leuconostoc gasicomitatum]|uniref:glycosyltransferase family A protein n=1 Tax=Leuconostoc gasicomitatum TaxID=115778 RepID=UPI001CC378AF|nr:glycosyltransferase family A protein [Leuconostoc gasicomitatum]